MIWFSRLFRNRSGAPEAGTAPAAGATGKLRSMLGSGNPAATGSRLETSVISSSFGLLSCRGIKRRLLWLGQVREAVVVADEADPGSQVLALNEFQIA